MVQHGGAAEPHAPTTPKQSPSPSSRIQSLPGRGGAARSVSPTRLCSICAETPRLVKGGSTYSQKSTLTPEATRAALRAFSTMDW